MKKLLTTLAAASTLIVGSVFADTLELADGTLLEGNLVGSSNGIIMFNTGASIEAFPENEVVGIFLSSGVATAEARALAPAPTMLTVPTGTRLVIRTSDTIDSRRHSAGHRFRGQLEGALMVNGVTAVPRGTFLYGRISRAQQSGRLAGSSELAIEFTDVMINDQLIAISTSGLQAQGGNEARRTVGRTARAAAIGGLAGGSRGARTGARVGAGASLVTQGSSINIPAGTIMETSLSAALILQQ
jgi:hypothetical protein